MTVEAAHSKHRRRDVLPLRADLVEALRADLTHKAPQALAFNVPDKPAAMLAADLADRRTA